MLGENKTQAPERSTLSLGPGQSINICLSLPSHATLECYFTAIDRHLRAKVVSRRVSLLLSPSVNVNGTPGSGVAITRMSVSTVRPQVSLTSRPSSKAMIRVLRRIKLSRAYSPTPMPPPSFLQEKLLEHLKYRKVDWEQEVESTATLNFTPTLNPTHPLCGSISMR